MRAQPMAATGSEHRVWLGSGPECSLPALQLRRPARRQRVVARLKVAPQQCSSLPAQWRQPPPGCPTQSGCRGLRGGERREGEAGVDEEFVLTGNEHSARECC